MSMDLPRDLGNQANGTATRLSEPPATSSSLLPAPWSNGPLAAPSLLGKGFERASDFLNPGRYLRPRSGISPEGDVAQPPSTRPASQQSPPSSPTTTTANPLASSLNNPERNDYTLSTIPSADRRSPSPAPSLSLTQYGSSS